MARYSMFASYCARVDSSKFMNDGKLDKFNHSILVRKYGLEKRTETELSVKIDETNKELEKAGKSILQVANYCLKQRIY